MLPMRFADALTWCTTRNIVFTDQRRTRLAFESGHPLAIAVRVPEPALRILALGYVLLTSDDEDEEAFSGGLLWVNAWDIWSESFERVGWRITEGLRGADNPLSLRDAPGQLFGSGEFVDAQALLLQPMLFQWDAHYIPSSGGFFAHVSHHGDLAIVARDRELGDRLFARFEEGEWNPRESPAP